jgi:hypothetical protein
MYVCLQKSNPINYINAGWKVLPLVGTLIEMRGSEKGQPCLYINSLAFF